MIKRKLELRQNGISDLNERIDFLREVAAALVDEVKSLDLPVKIEFQNNVNFDDEVKRFEIYLIEQALDRTGGNQLRAARLLNLKNTTLNSKIKRYRISPLRRQIADANAFAQAI